MSHYAVIYLWFHNMVSCLSSQLHSLSTGKLNVCERQH